MAVMARCEPRTAMGVTLIRQGDKLKSYDNLASPEDAFLSYQYPALFRFKGQHPDSP